MVEFWWALNSTMADITGRVLRIDEAQRTGYTSRGTRTQHYEL